MWSAVQYGLQIAAQCFIWYDLKMFTTLDEKQGRELITLVGNHHNISKSIGAIRVKAQIGSEWQNLSIENARWVPERRKNLFSLMILIERGIDMKFTNGNVKMFFNGQLIAMSAKVREIL